MLTTIVHMHVKPEYVNEFIEACRLNHEGSIKEPGNRRFDFAQSKEDPTYFIFYEAFESAEAVAAHKQTAHYAKWRDTVTHWMAETRKSTPFNGLFPK